jgi:hypothetical protein
MIEGDRIDLPFHFARRGGRNVLVQGKRPAELVIVTGKLARFTCMMAIAIHFDQLISEGAIDDFAEVACLENVSQPRVTQILNLSLLAPDIQETLLHLPRMVRGHHQINFRTILSVSLEPDWKKQGSKMEEIQKGNAIRDSTSESRIQEATENTAGQAHESTFFIHANRIIGPNGRRIPH